MDRDSMPRDPMAREGERFEREDPRPVGLGLPAALQRAFDERRDPLDDPECVEALAADPAVLERWARLHARLAALATTSTSATATTAGPATPDGPVCAVSNGTYPVQLRRRRPVRVAVALAAALAAALAIAVLPFPEPRATTTDAADLALPAPRLDYHPPLARAAAEVLVREDLIDDGTTRLVVVETRTFPR